MPKPIQATHYTFRDIIEGGFLYVDKTRQIYELVRYGIGNYFLSRPRRFGKSLTVSTLEEIFQGEKELFQGLWIYDRDYDWEPFPIVHIDFGFQSVTTADETKQAIESFLERIAAENALSISGYDYQSKFTDLVGQLAKSNNGKVVLLIDEYDKPIIDNITNIEEAKKIRDVLRGLYGVVKALNSYWRFVFITGVSRFSRVGIFSVMNNLQDLTMSPLAADLCGITEDELQNCFYEHIQEFAQQEQISTDELLDRIRMWYNGFQFASTGNRVYNPLSVIQALLDRRFSNFWFFSGTPSFLIQLFQTVDYDIPSLEGVEVDELFLQTFDLENLAIIPLLYQTGYLTIKDYTRDEFGETYLLSYPNYEVKSAFVTYLLDAYRGKEPVGTQAHIRSLTRSLNAHNLAGFFEHLNGFFANIDYDLHLRHEKYYQTIFYMIMLLIGVRASAEVKTNRGRIDAVIELADQIYIFEFKLDESAETALQQTKDKEYAEKYRNQNKPITLVGANFDSEQRKITDWTSEEI